MLCLCAWSEWFYLSLITVKYVEEKSFQRRLQCRWQLFKSPTAPECMCVTATIWNIPLCFCAMCVGSCQKVYPIITDSYHYHFLSLWSLPLIQLIKSANVNIHFNLQSCLIGPVEPASQSEREMSPPPLTYSQETPFTLTVHLFLVFHKVPQTNTSLPSQISTREG